MAANDVVITALNVRPTASSQIQGGLVLGETITNGQWVYRKASDSKYYRAQADGTLEESGNGTELYWILSGGALDEIGVGVLVGNIIVGGTLVEGKVYVISDTLGAITLADDIIASWFTTVAGIAVNTTELEIIGNATGYGSL